MLKQYSSVLLFCVCVTACAQSHSLSPQRPDRDGLFAIVIVKSDTLYAGAYPQGNEVIRYQPQHSGEYVVMDRSGMVKMRCYLNRGRLLGYYQIYDSQGVTREDGYYVDGVKIKSRRL